MASRTPQMEYEQSSSFHLKAPHFFKIILHTMIQSGKLTIPQKFVRKYGAELSKSDVVLLHVPSGDAWEVKLRAGDGAIWLENGWPDFMNFYSIKHGDFLVFCYKSRSSNEFDVLLFDKSATEIEYPIKNYTTDENNVCPKALKGAERVKALERAKSFKSSNPYFLVVMQPYYVHPSYKLHVPVKFLQTHIGENGSGGELKLRVSGEKVWTVKYNISVRGTWLHAKVVPGWKAFVVDNGLVVGDVCVFEFIRGLKSTSFRVTIFRAPPPAISCALPLQASGGGGAASSEHEGCSGAKFKGKEKTPSSDMKQVRVNNQNITRCFDFRPGASLFTSEYPYFQVVMTKSYLSHWKLNIPSGFVRDHLNLESKEQTAALKVGNRSWPTKVIISCPSLPRAVFSCGFHAFAKENTLKARDICTFELIQRAEIVFRVSINRVKKDQKK
ncbi:hypothetical protein CDL15_Pgr013522 [Punica granatum]|uniref:TF-B3 domain-containing protein n=1 Tax=Punica granatum TaxID=22663 RepID=A0A218W0N2_PUNGR|nr:hypothetical protein CDL15_Pgr013522 [Punica granatum]